MKEDIEVEKIETTTTETSDEQKALAIAKDLVELAVQTQKVLALASISYANIEEARLLAIMTNEVIAAYTTKGEKDA